MLKANYTAGSYRFSLYFGIVARYFKTFEDKRADFQHNFLLATFVPIGILTWSIRMRHARLSRTLYRMTL